MQIFMRHLIPAFLFLTAFHAHAQNAGDKFFAENTLHEIRIYFAQSNYIDSLTRNYTLDAYMQCKVRIDGIDYDRCGGKWKGNSSYNNPSKKKSWRLDLTEYGMEQSFDGLDKFVLNNGFKDPTFLREKMMLDFLNAHGIEAPRASFARVFVNGSYWGLYTVVEDIGKPFLKRHFNNKDGNLFKGDPRGDLRWKNSTPASYYTDYELKTNETENNWSDLIHFIALLNNTPVDRLEDSLNTVLNTAGWLSYWAAHNLFVNLDSYIGSGHNYYLYHNTDSKQFEWITWDVNEAFGNFNMGLSLAQIKTLPFTHIPLPMTNRPIMKRLIDLPAYKQKLAQRECALLQAFSIEKLGPRIDELAALIRQAAYTDSLKFFGNQQFELNLNQDLGNIPGLRPFIRERRSSLLAQLTPYGCTLTAVDQQDSVQPNFTLFPNPAHEGTTIRTTGSRIVAVRISDMTGRLLRVEKGNNTADQHILLTGLPPGLYIVCVEQAGGNCLTAKLLVQ